MSIARRVIARSVTEYYMPNVVYIYSCMNYSYLLLLQNSIVLAVHNKCMLSFSYPLWGFTEVQACLNLFCSYHIILLLGSN